MTRKSLRKVDSAVVWPTVVIKIEKDLFPKIKLRSRVDNGGAVPPDKNKKCGLIFEQVDDNLVDYGA